jgi:hypothetical protein
VQFSRIGFLGCTRFRVEQNIHAYTTPCRLTSPRISQAAMGSGEALKTRRDIADGTPMQTAKPSLFLAFILFEAPGLTSPARATALIHANFAQDTQEQAWYP